MGGFGEEKKQLTMRQLTHNRIHPSHGRRLALALDEIPQPRIITVAVAKHDQALEALQIPSRSWTSTVARMGSIRWRDMPSAPWRTPCQWNRCEHGEKDGGPHLD